MNKLLNQLTACSLGTILTGLLLSLLLFALVTAAFGLIASLVSSITGSPLALIGLMMLGYFMFGQDRSS
ncbi:hypothetical protein Deipr_2294 (plasmid) [Deinococcus proteolyticus MRP]|uniref:Uncharacterized protein n=1 Tax=Deinococcus proteolyticus (strain ATCC 35074 / DSM 20540 / JCM 6276 / NBRC 101906 / NCIMB 13154 / VKM Ac-1939 / CCM 2703 / MRP) TaxID=693977 RepID=F0RQ60_DEIPM|nr:hypothetical protein [Deinococcus proteolyticus]ADY27419.1 hypothetical protein Deipr_2294 [Deinococcus proteolyticus MRP]